MFGNKHFEILVVGAGPVGMTTALLLAQQGIRVGVIDREAGPARRSYACALHPRSLEVLEQAGVIQDVLANGHRIGSIGFYEGSRRQAGVEFATLEARHPYVLVLPQSTLESLLAQKLARSSNVTLLWNHRLTDLDRKVSHIVARVDRLAKSAKGYSVPDVDWATESTLEIPCRYLIAADGHHSHVRRCLGIDYERTGPPQRFTVFELVSDASAGSEMKVVWHQQTASVLWPFAGRRCRWGFQLSQAEAVTEDWTKERDGLDIMETPGEEDSEHRLRKLLAARVPWFEQPIQTVEWSTEIQFEQRLAREFGHGRCWLVGDAAHQLGPVGMKSMNVGLAEGADLARRLGGVFHGRIEAGPLLAYDQVHRGEWRRLLGIEGRTVASGSATPWVAQHAADIPAMIPASGEHLEQLLTGMGLVTMN